MKLLLPTLALSLLAACDAGTPPAMAPAPPASVSEAASAPTSAQPARVPKVISQPELDADPFFTGGLSRLREDVSFVLRITIDAEGRVLSAVPASLTPAHPQRGLGLVNRVAEAFRQARFEPLPGAAYPYTFAFTVSLESPRGRS